MLELRGMESFKFLQPILGTDKKNPVFSVFEHRESKRYHVYYGLELFEVVPCDHEDTRFKLMVAHLHNVGVKLTLLQKGFGVDPRTIKKWSAALKSGDGQKLSEALAGRGARRKLTRAVEHYVRVRFASIYREDRYTYSSKIREELKELLGVELSAETLRPLLGELRGQLHPIDAQAAPERTEENPKPSSLDNPSAIAEAPGPVPEPVSKEQDSRQPERAQPAPEEGYKEA